MNKNLSKLIAQYKNTDLTYINPKNEVVSLIGSKLENKQKHLNLNETLFLQNLKVLRNLISKTDNRSKTISKRTFNVCKSCIESICKILSSEYFEVNKNRLKFTEEFERYLENENDLGRFIDKSITEYNINNVGASNLLGFELYLRDIVGIHGKNNIAEVVKNVLYGE